MAKIERGSFTPSGTPPFNLTVLFNDNTILADEIEFSLGPSGGTSDSICHSGTGLMTPTQQTAKAVIYGGATAGGKVEQVNTKCLVHYSISGSSLVKVLQGSRNDMSTTGQFTLTIDTLNGTQPIYFVARQY